MTDQPKRPAQPYRQIAERELPEPPSGGFKKAIRILAASGMLLAGYEMLREEGKIELELKTNPSMVELERLEKIKSGIQDGKNSLYKIPMLILPVCSEGSCAMFVSPEIDPNLAKARSFIIEARKYANGPESISHHIDHVLDSLPEKVKSSDDEKLCRDSIIELDSISETVDSQIRSTSEAASGYTKSLIAERNVLGFGLVASLLILLCVCIPPVKSKTEENS